MKNVLLIKNLHVEIAGKEILKGIDLSVRQGEIHALMGPNGSGKSTLSFTLMGHPNYEITKGDIIFNEKSLIGSSPDERAKNGLFLSFQYPVAVPGVSLANFLRTAYNSVKTNGTGGNKNQQTISVLEFQKILKEKMKLLQLDESFASRYLNEGLSGGEKKRCEVLQLAVLEPKIAILDETDSGLDIDSLKVVASGINHLHNPDLGILLITHYQRILRYIKPHFVHIMMSGKIVKSGNHKLAEQLEKKGYDWLSGK